MVVVVMGAAGTVVPMALSMVALMPLPMAVGTATTVITTGMAPTSSIGTEANGGDMAPVRAGVWPPIMAAGPGSAIEPTPVTARNQIRTYDSVTLPNIARNKSPGTSGSRSDDFTRCRRQGGAADDKSEAAIVRRLLGNMSQDSTPYLPRFEPRGTAKKEYIRATGVMKLTASLE